MNNETPPPPAPAGRTGTLRAWLQLVRLPALFTAMADIAAGFAMQTGRFEPVTQLASLLCASGCLYVAGMIFNDVFDRRRDAESGRDRPIPMGRISARAAAIVGTALMIAGILSAWSVSTQALYVALGLAACILAYDGLLKTTLLAPLAMGGCRFLNVMLGAATDDIAATVWDLPQIAVAAALGVYVLGVTWFARTEDRTSWRGTLIGGALVANLGMGLLALAYLGRPWQIAWKSLETFDTTLLALLVAAIALVVDRRLLAAILSPEPGPVQAGVKVSLLTIITLDATVVLAATGDIVSAFGVALLVVPALLIGRWLYLT